MNIVLIILIKLTFICVIIKKGKYCNVNLSLFYKHYFLKDILNYMVE